MRLALPARVLVSRRLLDDLHRLTQGRNGVAVTRHSLHALGIALSLAVSTCGLCAFTSSTFEQSPRQREDKRCPACGRELQRARIVHKARPKIDACVMLLDHKTRPAE